MSARHPSVFISSTCYDLGQVRENIKVFLESLGLQPVLSEYGTFPIDPDLSTVENCKRVVDERADIFVLIVGGRYGHVAEQGRSVTNLEYLQAKAKGVPIYVFVAQSVLTGLQFWSNNPEGNFDGIVDSPKVFEFVHSIRSSGKAWVYPFDSAQGITTTLRNQLAILLMDSLALRAKARQRELSDKVYALNGNAFRLALEKPDAWEYRLFSQVLSDELGKLTPLKQDLAYGLHFGDTELLEPNEFFRWMRSQLSQLSRISSGLTQLINTAYPEAIGLPGQAGDEDKIVYAAEKVAAAYKHAILWSLGFRRLEIHPELQTIANILARFSSDLVTKVEHLNSHLANALHDFLTNPPAPGERRNIGISLTFENPVTPEFDAELARLQWLLPELLDPDSP